MPEAALRVLAFNRGLKSASDEEASSTDVLLAQLLDALNKEGARGDIVRAVDRNIKPGVKSDEGAGDAWPALRQRVVDADILVIGTPIWLGQPSSAAKRILERMGECRPTARSGWRWWSATRMARTTPQRNYFKRSPKSTRSRSSSSISVSSPS
jgi:multimeric flavodoxin WrbA